MLEAEHVRQYSKIQIHQIWLYEYITMNYGWLTLDDKKCKFFQHLRLSFYLVVLQANVMQVLSYGNTTE